MCLTFSSKVVGQVQKYNLLIWLPRTEPCFWEKICKKEIVGVMPDAKPLSLYSSTYMCIQINIDAHIHMHPHTRSRVRAHTTQRFKNKWPFSFLSYHLTDRHPLLTRQLSVKPSKDTHRIRSTAHPLSVLYPFICKILHSYHFLLLPSAFLTWTL